MAVTFRQRVNDFVRAAIDPLVNKYLNSYYNGYQNPYQPILPDWVPYTDFRGVFFRMVQMRADMFSKYMQLAKVQRRGQGGKWKDVESSHPWVKLLERPNTNVSSREFWNWVSLQKDLYGPAVSVIDRPGLVPESLYPIYRDFGQVKPYPDGFGGVEYYVYQKNGGGEIERFEASEVLYLKHDNPFDPYSGLTLVDIARMQLDERKYMHEYRAKDLKTGGVTADMFTSPDRVDASSRTVFQEQIAKFKGARGKGMTLLLDQNVKPVDSKTARDLEFIDSLRENAEALKFITGLPLAFFDKGTNRAEKEAALVEFIEVTISPMVSAVCDQVTVDFERIFGAAPGVLRICPPDMHVPNEELEDRLFTEQIKTGRRVPNEWREMKGLTPLEGGDVPLVLGSLVPLRDVVAEPVTMEPVRSTRAAGDDPDGDTWRKIDASKKKNEKRCKRVVTGQFNVWEEQILDNLAGLDTERAAGTVAILTAAMVFDVAAAIADIEETLAPEVLEALRAGFESGAILADYDPAAWNFDNPEARVVFRQIMNLTRSIPETLLDELSGVIQKGMNDQVSIPELAVRIRSYFGEMKPWKSLQIAQTTVNSSWEAGQERAYVMAGMKGKKWVSQRDGRVRETHLLTDGDVVGVNDSFQVGTASLRFPGDPEGRNPSETINCRCSILPVKNV